MAPKISKQRTILEAARKVLSAADPHDVTMETVAAEAGVAKGTLFLYYPSKDALFAAVHSDLMNSFVSSLEAIRDSGQRGEKLLAAAVHTLVEHLARKTGLMEALGERTRHSSLKTANKIPKAQGVLRDILGKCAEDGLLRLEDPFYTASALFGLCRGSRAYARGKGRSLTAAEKTKRVLDIFLDGIRKNK